MLACDGRSEDPAARAGSAIRQFRVTEARLEDEQVHSGHCWQLEGARAEPARCDELRLALAGELRDLASVDGAELPAELAAGLALQRGRPATALLVLEARGAASPSALLALGAAYLERTRREERPLDLVRALDALARATEALPASPAAWFDLGLAASELHLCRAAERSLRTALSLERDPGWRGEIEQRLRAAACAAPRSPAAASAAEERSWQELGFDGLFAEGELAEIVRRVDAAVPVATGPALRGRLWWMRGTAQMGQGHLGDALASFDQAILSFREAGDSAREGFAHALLASAYSTAGDWERSWSHRRRGLALLARSGWRDRLDVALNAVAFEAFEEGLYSAANVVLEELPATAATDPTQRATHALNRARSLAALGRRDEAERLLAEHAPTRRSIQAIDPPQVALLLLHEAEALRLMDRPADAVAALGAAVERLQRRDEAILLADALAQRAAAQLALGAPQEARLDLLRTGQLLDRERGSLGALQRPAFLDASARLSDLAVEVELASGDAKAALARIEEATARTLREMRATNERGSAEAAFQTPPGTVILRYGVLEDELLTWRIDDTGTRLDRRPIARADLRRLALATAEVVRRGEAAAGSGAELGRLLLSGFDPSAALPARLIVVPDDVLYAVPFAALPLPGRPGFLIEHLALQVVPNLDAGWLGSRPRSAGDPLRSLWIADATVQGLPRLPGARAAAAESAAAYSRRGESLLLANERATAPAVLGALPSADLLEADIHSTSTATFLGSRLELAAEPGARQGLAAAEIAALDLRQLRLAVLASCDSSNSRYRGSEGIGGLQWAFLAAGAEAVVATLWEVSDQEAARFTSKLHRHLLAGRPLSAAMRHAARESMDGPGNGWAAFVHYGGDPRLVVTP